MRHDFFFRLFHHIIAQAGLQQVGEHLDVVAARTVPFADSHIDVTGVFLEIILQGKFRQQLQIIFADGTFIS